MNRRHNKDSEELRNFWEEYEIDQDEQKTSDDVGLREDICSFIQQITKLKRDLNDIQKNTKTMKHDAPYTLFESYQCDSIVQREMTNCRDTLSLENDMPTDPRTATNSAMFHLQFLYSIDIICSFHSLLMSAVKFKTRFLLRKRQIL